MATQTYKVASDDPRVAWAIFTVYEASRYLDVPYSTLRTWLTPSDGNGALVPTVAAHGHLPRLSFLGFAEAFVIVAAKKAGVPAHRIRDGVAAVRNEIGVDHALATHRLYVDKAELLVAPEGGTSLQEPADLEVARTRQVQMTRAVKQQLEHISYGTDGVAESLVLPLYAETRVIVDPRESFGAPIISRTGTRVRDIVSLWRADEDVRDIAYDFDLAVEEVHDVIEAERKKPGSGN